MPGHEQSFECVALCAPEQTLGLTGPVERAEMPLLPTRTVLCNLCRRPVGPGGLRQSEGNGAHTNTVRIEPLRRRADKPRRDRCYFGKKLQRGANSLIEECPPHIGAGKPANDKEHF